MTIHPRSLSELQDAVRSHENIGLRGAGTKSPSTSADERLTIDLSALRGITGYAPDECVITALAGTPLREISADLAAHGQYLPFDPPLAGAGATIGGTVAAGASGSGRYRYGGVRDFVIGARVVDGEGRLVRSGGHVVKNAAGFLLHHAIVGSLGRFAAIAEVTCKVFPMPEARATLCVGCGSPHDAWQRARALEQHRFDLEAIDFDSSGTLWLRVAGRTDALSTRVERLRAAVGGGELLEGDADDLAWSQAREFEWAGGRTTLIKAPGTHPCDLESGTIARYICGGQSAWIADDDLDARSAALRAAGLAGQVIRGRHAGTLVGAVAPNPFEARVRHALDPRQRFSAASPAAR